MAGNLLIGGVIKKYRVGSVVLNWNNDSPDDASVLLDATQPTGLPSIGQEFVFYPQGYSSPVWAGTIDEVGVEGLYEGSSELTIPIRALGYNTSLYNRTTRRRGFGDLIRFRGYTTTVSTNGTAVTRTAGDRFDKDLESKSVTINGVSYTVTTVTDPDHLTLGSSSGTQTDAEFRHRVYSGDIVKALVDNSGLYMDADGFTWDEGDIQQGAEIKEFWFDTPLYIAEALDRLLESNPDFTYWTDVDRKFHFAARTAVSASVSFTDSSGAYRRNIGLTRTREDVRNVEISVVKWEALGVTTQTITGDGSLQGWFLDHPIGKLVYVKLNGIVQKVGVDDTEGNDYFYHPGSRAIWQDPMLPVLTGSDSLEIGYYPSGNNLIEYIDSAAISARQASEGGGSGRYEKVVDRTTSPGQIEAQAEAQGSVTRFKDDLEKVRLVTWDNGVLPGQLVSVQSAKFGIGSPESPANFFVDRVSATDRGLERNSEHDLLYTIEAISSSRRISAAGVFRSLSGVSGASVGGGVTVVATSTPGEAGTPPLNALTVDFTTPNEERYLDHVNLTHLYLYPTCTLPSDHGALGITWWISYDNGTTWEWLGANWISEVLGGTAKYDVLAPHGDQTWKVKGATWNNSSQNSIGDAVVSPGHTVNGLADPAATAITDASVSAIDYRPNPTQSDWSWGATVTWTNPTGLAESTFFTTILTKQVGKVVGGVFTPDTNPQWGTEVPVVTASGQGEAVSHTFHSWGIPPADYEFRVHRLRLRIQTRAHADWTDAILQTGAFGGEDHYDLTPVVQDATPVTDVTLGTPETRHISGSNKTEIRVPYTAPADSRFVGVVVEVEAPDQSSAPQAKADGTTLWDGTRILTGDKKFTTHWFTYDSVNPQPISVTVPSPTYGMDVRLRVKSYSMAAVNLTGPEVVVTVEPRAPNKPNSGTAYGPNPTSISAGTVTTDMLDGKSKSYIPVTVTGVPTETGFLGYEVVGMWPNDPNEYVITGYEKVDGLLPYEIELDTPASVITLTLYVRGVYQQSDGSVRKNPIVVGVTPSTAVSFGTTSGTINLGEGVASSLASSLAVVNKVLGVPTAGITEALIAQFAVSEQKLADAATATAKIQDLAVVTGKMANLSVDTNKLGDLAATAAKLAGSAVTQEKIANLAVGTAAIALLAVGNGHLQNAAVTNAKIGNLAVSNANLQDAAVTTLKVLNGAITNLLLGDLAVSTAKIQDLAVTDAKIASLSVDKLLAGTITASISMTSPSLTITGSNWQLKIDTSNKVKLTNSQTGDVIEMNENGFKTTNASGWNSQLTSAMLRIQGSGQMADYGIDAVSSYVRVSQLRDCGYAAAVSVGSLKGRIPLYTGAGAIVGYIPVHNAT
jgi:hypothetical protein